jgi:hypothetical protein
MQRVLHALSCVALLALGAAGKAAATAEPRGRRLQSGEVDGALAGGLLLLGTFVVAVVFLIVHECTSQRDAFGRGPIEQLIAEHVSCLDRSKRRLNQGNNGRFASGGESGAVANPLAALPEPGKPTSTPNPITASGAAAPSSTTSASTATMAAKNAAPEGEEEAEKRRVSSADRAARVKSVVRESKKNRPKSFVETVNPMAAPGFAFGESDEESDGSNPV